MGTDIHAVFQRRVDEKWEDIPSSYAEDRHYFLFAWLAGVRNGYGCAGVPTHTPVKPLSSNRGFPDDFEVVDEDYHPIPGNEYRGSMAQYYVEEDSDPMNTDYLKKNMGDHSFTWLSADEILSATPPVVSQTGIISKSEFEKWDGVSEPENGYCGGIGGGGVVVSTPDTVTDRTTHVRISWQSDAAIEFKYFLDEIRRLQMEYGEVRMVFGFDS